MSTATKTRELETIATANIVVVDGHNPRGNVDTKGAAFAELVASIKEHGILQPILVGPAGADGKHPIVAGHRRHAAAKKAGLKSIPAMVADMNGDGFSAAVAENLIREDMSPLQEAQAIAKLRDAGMKQREAAKALGKSERWTRDREQLLDLPDVLQKAVDKGEIPLEAGKVLAPIAKVSAEAAQKLVAAATKADQHHRLADKTVAGLYLAEISKSAGLQPIHGSNSWDSTSPGTLPIAAAARKEIQEEWKKLPSPPWGQKPGIRFDHHDAKVAKERGALLEVSLSRWGRTERVQYITDAELVAERAKKKLPGMKRRIEKEIKEAAETRLRGASKAEKERAKKEQEAREAAAEAVNEQLGRSLAAFAPKVSDVDAVRLVCAMALGGGQHDIQANVAHGLGAIAPEYDSDGVPGGAVLLDQLAAAKTPDECVRLVLQMAVAAKFTKETGWTRLGGPPGVEQMIEDLALKSGVLPTSLVREIEARQRVEAEREGAVLKAIASQKEIDHRDLASELHLAPVDVRRIVDRLVEQGRAEVDDHGHVSIATVAAVGG